MIWYADQGRNHDDSGSDDAERVHLEPLACQAQAWADARHHVPL